MIKVWLLYLQPPLGQERENLTKYESNIDGCIFFVKMPRLTTRIEKMNFKKLFVLTILSFFGIIFSGLLQAKGIPTVNRKIGPNHEGDIRFYNFQLKPKDLYTIVCSVHNLSKTDEAHMLWGTYSGTTVKHIYVDGIEKDVFEEFRLTPDGTKNSFHVLSATGLIAGSDPTNGTFLLENWSGQLTPPSAAIVDASCTIMTE